MATQHNLQWVRGDSRSPAFTITDGNGDAVDLSGATVIKFTIKTAADNDTVVLQKTKVASQIAVSGASSNVVTVTITAGDTAAFVPTAKYYEYDLEITLASTAKVTPVHGYLSIIEDQTTA